MPTPQEMDLALKNLFSHLVANAYAVHHEKITIRHTHKPSKKIALAILLSSSNLFTNAQRTRVAYQG